jgi:xylulokinase
MLAAVACGAYPSVEECARKLVSVRERIEPDPNMVGAYDERYQVWHGLYPALRQSYQLMAQMAQ